MARYGSHPPRWIVTRYPAKDRAGNEIPKGTRAFYYPATSTFLTGAEAEQAARDYESALFDERQAAH